eukprot:TRINITY_DN112854_c0_g1_i1.p1 TRINITY_DN112854_c0_g1~~TRINITY_DN112854_c0_g1_i1.p1  ORF type:complete len:313 (+),score=34.74 TRINITY_DN112854_c0_g1_i1:126-941(+)
MKTLPKRNQPAAEWLAETFEQTKDDIEIETHDGDGVDVQSKTTVSDILKDGWSITDKAGVVYRIAMHKSFSDWKWPEVKSKLGIKLPVPSFQPDKKDLEEAVLHRLKHSLEQKKKLGTVISEGSEPARQEYVSAFLYDVAEPYCDKLQIGREEEGDRQLFGTYAHGPVEYLVRLREASTVVVVIEVKVSEIDQGRAQCYMQLHAAAEATTIPQGKALYGFVTTAASWLVIKYDGDKFFESPKFAISDTMPWEQVKEVATSLNWVLATQSNF